MRIRQGSTPSSNFAPKSIRGAVPRVIPGRVVKPSRAIPSILSPVHFYAEADIPSGGEATLRGDALSNRTGRPIEIHEIRLSAGFTSTETVSVEPAAFVKVRMTVGGKTITNTFIPLFLFGKIENLTSQNASAVGQESNSIYVWRLSRPWHLPPGASVDVQFQHGGAVRFAATGRIGLAGRYVDRKSPTSAIPFAAAYISRPFTYDEVGFDESSERDLINVTGKDVTIDRLSARVAVARSGGGSAFAGTVISKNDFSQVYGVTLRVLTSNNLPIIRDYSSVFGIFGFEGVIDMPHVLSKGDFYRVGVRKVAGPVITTPFTTWTAQANVGILGWREEAI